MKHKLKIIITEAKSLNVLLATGENNLISMVNNTKDSMEEKYTALVEEGQELKELVDACEARGEETKEMKSLTNPDGWT